MDNNEKLIEYQIQSLISLRNTYISVFALLTGGLVGLSFTNQNILRDTYIIIGTILAILIFLLIIQCIKRLQLLFKILKGCENDV